ncbi:dipeptidase [Clostridium senegalense]|uniref:dipeptidase n=1 Tax=Clostridium senegalense TaxID=1465809 RepID=UPI000287E35E|nr:dipeptidase [Clostridium senegalense]
MAYIDLHCDTASRMLYEGLDLRESECKVSIEKLIKGGGLAQFFAFFVELDNKKDPFLEFKNQYDNFIYEVSKNKDKIQIVTNLKELEKCNLENKVGAFLTIEEGEVLKDNIDMVEEVYKLGIRLITLTWNYKNSLGYPNFEFVYKDNGLTDKGKEVVEAMEHFGIIPDCSHLSDKGFYDLVDICKKPFIASHSNARTITNHPRNLTDDMIKKLALKGGVMGINFCSVFLGESEEAKISQMINHIKHIVNVGGIGIVALGSDFDGIENEVEIKNTSEMNNLAYALKKEGLKESDIEKIFFKNVKNVLKETLK